MPRSGRCHNASLASVRRKPVPRRPTGCTVKSIHFKIHFVRLSGKKKILSKFLGLDESIIHTVIFFVGDCKFKTRLPPNVIKSGLGRYIKRFRNSVLSSNEIKQISGKLEQHMSESTITTRDHVRSLRKRHSSKTVCPRCGSNLVKRTVKKGPRAGSKFLGCDSYPKCRFTKKA